jgi:hypothetical protein
LLDVDTFDDIERTFGCTGACAAKRQLRAARLAKLVESEADVVPVFSDSTVLITGHGDARCWWRGTCGRHGVPVGIVLADGRAESYSASWKRPAQRFRSRPAMSDRDALRQLLAAIPAEHPCAVVHTAGVLDDGSSGRGRPSGSAGVRAEGGRSAASARARECRCMRS